MTQHLKLVSIFSDKKRFPNIKDAKKATIWELLHIATKTTLPENWIQDNVLF